GMTALHIAIQSMQASAVKILLNHGSDVNSKVLRGWIALHVAASAGSTDCVTLLLQHNAE
ncbi:hypothetical protein EJ04DRAFT_392835, partial [Polyplosphaeria fusca]